ncbi:MAG: ComEC/Rec2 family competence protein [Oscillospiraceae bacterium]|nr:ComEC/Rec2 family competence protein [Oscillospiraceae bacterium]
MRKIFSRIKKILLCFTIIASLVVTYAPKYIDFIPDWQKIYSIAGIFEYDDIRVYNYPLVVVFIDVGQGDAIYIKYQKGDGTCENILIDSGEKGSDRKVLSVLNAYDVKELDYFIESHPHSDHIGSAPDLLKGMKVKNFLYPFETTLPEEIKTQIEKDNEIACKASKIGDVIILNENCSLTVLGPGSEYNNENDMSMVLRLVYENTSFLFTGDSENAAEYSLMSGAYEGKWEIKSNVLKVAHHGSDSSSGEDFIKAVGPEYAVISCGKNNEFGHPHALTLKTLAMQNIKTLRTDLLGTITICSNGENIISCN